MCSVFETAQETPGLTAVAAVDRPQIVRVFATVGVLCNGLLTGFNWHHWVVTNNFSCKPEFITLECFRPYRECFSETPSSAMFVYAKCIIQIWKWNSFIFPVAVQHLVTLQIAFRAVVVFYARLLIYTQNWQSRKTIDDAHFCEKLSNMSKFKIKALNRLSGTVLQVYEFNASQFSLGQAMPFLLCIATREICGAICDAIPLITDTAAK